MKCTKIVGVEGDDVLKKKKKEAGWKAQLIKKTGSEAATSWISVVNTVHPPLIKIA